MGNFEFASPELVRMVGEATTDILKHITEVAMPICFFSQQHPMVVMASLLTVSLDAFIEMIEETSKSVDFENCREKLLIKIKIVLEKIIIEKLSKDFNENKTVH